MFNKIKHLKPEKVSFKLEDGKPCFYTYRVFTRRNPKTKKQEYTQKQLNQISRELFNINQFNKKNPKLKDTWTLTEEETGISKGHCWILKFFPFTGEENPEKCSKTIKSVLELMHP